MPHIMTDSPDTAADPRLERFLGLSEILDGQRLTAPIPRDCYQPRVWRGLLGFSVSFALYAGAVLGVAAMPSWLLCLPLWALAGLGGWGLHCIAHDCGHGSFSRSRLLNLVVGQAALLPLLYPFHAWRHVHNMHHSHTNDLELDTDWRPLPAETYGRLPAPARAVYASLRTWAFWGGTIRYWLVSGFRPGFFPSRAMRRDVWRSIAVTVPLGAAYLAFLTAVAGVGGVVCLFVMPWIAIHVWFSATTLMHHSDEEVPFLDTGRWTRTASRILVTTDYTYPRLLAFLTHNISTHTPHHVAPGIPFYNLPRAQAALKVAFPDAVREHVFSFRRLWHIISMLHLHDAETGYYTDFSGHRVGAAAPRPTAQREAGR